MKKMILFCFVASPFFFSCAGNEEKTAGQPENDVDAATMFIRSALDGKWKEARTLIVQDSANIEDLDIAERVAQRRNVTEQRSYRESQIIVHDTHKVNDSTTIVVYSNTFKNQRDSIKTVRVAGQWLVDLKYSFPNNPVQQ